MSRDRSKHRVSRNVQFIKPQLATLYDDEVPAGKWLYEVKFDGYRMQANRELGKSRFFTRSGLDWLHKFSFIEAGMERLPPDVVIDGEVVSVEPNGRSNFSQLQDDIKRGRPDRMTFYAFDLLYLNGEDLRTLPQLERKLRLKKVLKKISGMNYSEHHTDGAKEMWAHACELNLEGLIAKRPDAPYRSGRNENS